MGFPPSYFLVAMSYGQEVYMVIETMEIRLFAPWVHSLKEKRMIVKSLTAKTRNQFNVSVAEWEIRTFIKASFGTCLCGRAYRSADSIMDHVIAFIENNTEAEIIGVRREIR
jgi:uncharacterized protein YlxP (DUF503 family)